MNPEIAFKYLKEKYIRFWFKIIAIVFLIATFMIGFTEGATGIILGFNPIVYLM